MNKPHSFKHSFLSFIYDVKIYHDLPCSIKQSTINVYWQRSVQCSLDIYGQVGHRYLRTWRSRICIDCRQIILRKLGLSKYVYVDLATYLVHHIQKTVPIKIPNRQTKKASLTIFVIVKPSETLSDSNFDPN